MKIIIYILCMALITTLGAATDEQREEFQKECDNNRSSSCHNMGIMYEYGDGVKKDDAKALSFYIKACDKNSFKSCSSAAVLYEDSRMLKQDTKKAFKLYSKACGGGDGFGCHNSAVYYGKRKTSAMTQISIALYSKACDAGYAESCIYLGRLYRDSRSVKPDFELAKEKFDLACELNNMLGCKELRILEELKRAGY